MLPSQRQVDATADRIETLYLRRCPPASRQADAVRGVWETAAAGLLLLHQVDSDIPVDPELYVTVQTLRGGNDFDPWRDLASELALERYRMAVTGMIHGLRRELRSEIRRAERLVRRGACLEDVLGDDGQPLSPLGRFITAFRAGRPDLMRAFRDGAESQHLACPLYHAASQSLLPESEYPFPGSSGPRPEARSKLCFSAN